MRLEGLPLALELAATWIPVLPPALLLGRLGNRLPLLTQGPQDLPNRHRTLRRAIESSYELLGSEERALFQALGVFTGGCTLPAVEAVWGTGPISPEYCGEAVIEVAPGEAVLRSEPVVLLAALERKSLIKLEAQSSEPRFAMLETIREYAGEQLSLSAREEVIRCAHAQYYLSLALQADAGTHGPSPTGQPAQLAGEHGNMREALHWAFSSGAEALGAQLAAALGRFWHLHGHWSEGRKWLTRALEVTGIEPPLRATLLHRAGVLAYRQRDNEQALAFLEEALRIRRAQGSLTEIAEVLQDLSILAVLKDEYSTATSLLEEAIELQRKSGGGRGLGEGLAVRGFLAMAQGQLELAEAFLGEAESIFIAAGDRWGLARVRQHMGQLAIRQHDYMRARLILERNVALNEELGNRSGVGGGLGELGLVALAQGDYLEAELLTKQGLAHFDVIGGAGDSNTARYVLGIVAFHKGEYSTAKDYLVTSLEAFLLLNSRHDVACCLVGLSAVYMKQGQLSDGAYLAGAAESLLSGLSGALDPITQNVYNSAMSALRPLIDDPDHADVAAAYKEGSGDSLEAIMVRVVT